MQGETLHSFTMWARSVDRNSVNRSVLCGIASPVRHIGAPSLVKGFIYDFSVSFEKLPSACLDRFDVPAVVEFDGFTFSSIKNAAEFEEEQTKIPIR